MAECVLNDADVADLAAELGGEGVPGAVHVDA
jgi:hypothetical protein